MRNVWLCAEPLLDPIEKISDISKSLILPNADELNSLSCYQK